MKINEILSPSIRQVLKPRKQQTPLWQQRQSCDSDFCRAVVANGYMTSEQMQEAALRYRLGCSRSGGVIFWQIDTLEQICDGKIMYYRPDCHRDHQRHPQWVSNLLKRQFLGRFPEMAPWMPETHHCLFGTHQLSEELIVKSEEFATARTIAVVEAEKTAVIMMDGDVDCLVGSVAKTAGELKEAAAKVGADKPAAYFCVHCGGRRAAIADRIGEVADSFTKEADGVPFIAEFTFGEYGFL